MMIVYVVRYLLVLVMVGLGSAKAGVGNALPNFVYVLTDDLGWNHPGYMNPNIRSPTLDALAADGAIMDRHYVYRYCAPTRGSFLTGRYPFRLDATRANLIPWSLPDGINTSYTYLPKHLKKAGYMVHHIGKWHQGFWKYEMTPPGRGFDSSFGFLVGGEDHFTSITGKCPGFPIVDLSYGWAANRTVTPAYGQNGTYTGHLFSDWSVEIIRNHDNSIPLFMYVALHNTHAPVEAPPEYVALYNFTFDRENHFDAQVTFVDHTVKNITDALKEKGLWDNTLFVWTTDNGSPPSVAGSNHPLRGGKGSLWDGGYRVPGFINGGVLPASLRGKHLIDPIHISDWWPTLAKLARLPTDDAYGPTPVDGIDQSDYILGKIATGPRKEIVLDHIMYCVAPGDVSQCVPGQTPDFPEGHYPNHTTGALVQRQQDGHLWKLIIGPAQQATWYGSFSPNATSGPINYGEFVACWPQPCLFDITADPTEHADQYTAQPQIARSLMARVEELEASYHPSKTNPPQDEAGLCASVAAHGGFMAPWYRA